MRVKDGFIHYARLISLSEHDEAGEDAWCGSPSEDILVTRNSADYAVFWDTCLACHNLLLVFEIMER